MKPPVLGFLLLLTLLPAQAIFAQEGQRARETFWSATLSGGEFIIPHSAITSISLHTYVVDGTVSVTEATVGTVGSEIGRFYYLEPIEATSPIGVGQSAIDDLKERAREVVTRVGAEDLEEKVIKNYPASTHAHTVEFRLSSPEDVKKLFGSLKNSLLQRRTANFSVKD